MKKNLLFFIVFIIGTYGFGQYNSEPPPEEEEEVVIPQPELVSSWGDVLLDQTIDEETYIIGPGDRLKLAISGPLQSVSVLIVSPTGKVLIPEIGALSLKKKTLSESISLIKNLIQQEIEGAKIYVDLLTVREFKALVFGAVEAPGFYKVNAAMRIYEIGNLAQLKAMADLSNIIVHKSSGETLYCDWYELIDRGDLAQNPYLQEGDRLYIPFASESNKLIAVRGAAKVNGYYALGKDETLSSFLNRTIGLLEVADISSIYVIRNSGTEDEYIQVEKSQFSVFRLEPEDILQLLRVESIRVNGYVSTPGIFTFVPGQDALDYIAAAGGALPNGDLGKIKLIREGKTISYNVDTILKPGDIIEVKRTFSDILFGEISVLQFITSTATIVLSYLAINN